MQRQLLRIIAASRESGEQLSRCVTCLPVSVQLLWESTACGRAYGSRARRRLLSEMEPRTFGYEYGDGLPGSAPGTRGEFPILLCISRCLLGPGLAASANQRSSQPQQYMHAGCLCLPV